MVEIVTKCELWQATRQFQVVQTLVEIMAKCEERTPYVIVCFQECDRMNTLTNEMKRSLKELDLGLKGELTITSDMEDLSSALFFDQVTQTLKAHVLTILKFF